jgi:hypothetical protein
MAKKTFNTDLANHLLRDVSSFLRRFVVMTEEQAAALALWTGHTHAFDAADVTPYVAVTSALKRSGKTQLLEVMELLVRNPLPTANISDAALFRAIGEKKPTLLFDEIDAIFGPKARDREDLRGMLNAGYRRGAVTYRIGGGNNRTLENFPVFAPKAFAGIGDLPDTIADRAIVIRLERRTRDEPIERFRRRDNGPDGHELRDRLADWLEPQIDHLREVRPTLPDELDDRAQDIWEPLLAIADLASEDWSRRARAAAVALSANGTREEEEFVVKLLHDIAAVFNESGEERMPTADLIDRLATIEESPWGDYYGKPITPQTLSKLLRPFRIKTMPIWVVGAKHRGYKLEQFENAFLRVGVVEGGRHGRDGFQGQNGLPPPTAPTALENQGGSRDPASGAASTAPTAPTAFTVNAVPSNAPDWERAYWARKGKAAS